jgi:hypothetical protein
MLLLHWWRCCVHIAVERLLMDEVDWLLHGSLLLKILNRCLLIWSLRVIWEGHLILR